MKTFIAIFLCTGLVSSLAKGSEIKEKAKRLILTFSTCNDVLSNCAAYGQSVCSDANYAAWAKENCKKTCNLCSSGSGGGGVPPLPGSGTSSCSDKLSDCSAYQQSSCSGQYLQWATENCAKRCNLCSSRSSSNPASGVATGPVPGGDGSFSSSSSGCYYNKQLYQQDQTWNDGCKYKCRCVDGTAGKYECRQLCLDWNLPPTCSMNPPSPGKCCPKPSCPSNIVVQYPQGYVEE